MSAALSGCRDLIATTWEALTPPSETGRRYHHFRGKADALAKGAGGHRHFYFTLGEGDPNREIDGSASGYKHEFEAHVHLYAGGKTTITAFDFFDEARALMNALDNLSAWPSGVYYAQAQRYAFKPLATDTLELTITIVAETRET